MRFTLHLVAFGGGNCAIGDHARTPAIAGSPNERHELLSMENPRG